MRKNVGNTAEDNCSLAAIRLAETVIRILDVKCRNGCIDEHRAWDGFQNGNGVECGVDIERLIRQAKRYLSKNR